MADLHLNFAVDIEATDTDRRTITGRVVPYGVAGNTSVGPVQFTAGALTYDLDNVKLLLEHDQRRPIGKAVQLAHGDDGIVGTFRVSATTAGADALIEAADGLRDGLSVGVRVTAHEDGSDGSMTVTAAELEEVSLVVRPAFTDARVTDVAASESDPETSEEAAPMPEHTEAVTEEVTATAQEHTEVEATAPATVQMQVRDRAPKKLTAGELIRHTILAGSGNRDSEDLLRVHANAPTVEPTTTGDVGGIVPTPQMRDIIGIIDSRRPFIDRIDTRTLPASGMSFKVPVRGTKVGDFIQVDEGAENEAEKVTFTETEVSVVTFKKRQIATVEAIDRTDPSLIQDQLVQLAEAWAQTTDKYALGVAVAAGQDSEAADLRAATIKAIGDSAPVVRQRPEHLLLSNDSWQDYLELEDGVDRPLYPGYGMQNTSGTSLATNETGIIEGLRSFVNYNAPAATKLVFPSMAVRYYQAAGAPVTIRAAQVGTMEWEWGVYGYVACFAPYANAIRKVGLSSAT